jgi:hypothetical protein
MTTVAKSQSFALARDWMGHYVLTRASDGKSLYFQGGDAVEVESEVEAPGFDLDTWASDYDACIETWD